MSEREMLDLLQRRYSHVRPGTAARRYAVAEHVSNTGGAWSAGPERIADFLAQDTYRVEVMPDGRPAGYDATGSRQRGEYRHMLHGHEVKVCRRDWSRELSDPSKSESWMRYCDRWWLVAPKGLVAPGELPPGWGMLCPRRNGALAVAVQAPLLTPEPMPAYMRAQIMRSTQKTAARAAERAALVAA